MNLTPKEKAKQAVVVGGLGVVGKATREIFQIQDYFDLRGSNINLKEIAQKKRYIFLCLPTPANQSGYDTSAIFQIIKQIEQYPGGQHIFINRSTVLPGTTAHINNQFNFNCVIHNPEFLTMRTLEQDIKSPDIVIIGADKRSDYGAEILDWYGDIIKNNKTQYFLIGTRESEMSKLAINNFYSLKVTFANQIYDVCQEAGVNYDQVKQIMYARKWIGKNHLDVWHDGKRGFAGMCLPKDNQAFNRAFQKPLLQMVEKLNELYLGISKSEKEK